jgi:hypothetical protein
MKTLFPEPRPRRANGQFATKEMAYADKQREENKRLRREADMYQRMYLTLYKENQKLKQKIENIKSIL